MDTNTTHLNNTINTKSVKRLSVFVTLLFTFAMGMVAQEVTTWWPEGPHATGIDNGVVYLNDLEDHTWTYYSGVDASVDGGNYNDKYKGFIYSPNPRNVMITYKGVNDVEGSTTDVKVSIDSGEDQHTFVYYKTLEQGPTTGEYPYTVISNPFSVRPSTGSGNDKVYYGFNGWKIIDGGDFIKGYKNGDILPLDAEIVFDFRDADGNENYTTNCISANIELQATWVQLNQIVHLSSTSTETSNYEYNADGGTYETNILVLTSDIDQHIIANSPCTVMMVEPDGSANYRNNCNFKKLLRPAEGVNNKTKIEFTHWTPSGNIYARGRNFTIGRGMKIDGTERILYGTYETQSENDYKNVSQILKVESGKFSQLIHYEQLPESIIKQWVILGCDYDRAKGVNDKLEFTKDLRVATDMTLPTTEDSEIFRTYSLSGSFVTSENLGNAAAASCYYLSVRDAAEKVLGHRYLEILGGRWKNLAGGWSPGHPEDKRSLTIRIKGGNIEGSVYGGAQHVDASGIVTYIITGGTINGWIAGGANGTTEDGGLLSGSSYIYVGGKARIDSQNKTGNSAVINRAVGGNVFGAGCGFNAGSKSGQVTLGTNVVIADNAYVERGVYGGGSYGYTNATSNIYITGGTIDGKVGGVNGTSYNSNIPGGVYGGACQNKAGNVNIYMTGGTVNGGIYGGSNESGALSGSVNMTMTGGTVNGNIFGGGNKGNVIKDSEGNGGNTIVTIIGGTVTGNVYGGGNQAAVTGTTKVVVGSSRQ